MNRHSLACCVLICASVLLVGAVNLIGGDDHQNNSPESRHTKKTQQPFTVQAAKERSQLMHQIYAATLDAMHHHYFRANKSVLPARAMEDIFADVARETQSTARWISVNTKPMSIDHEPKTDFERTAASEIAAGKPMFDRIEDGFYRRAGAIPLSAGCVGCHMGMFNDPGSTPRYAALIISIPVQD